MGVILTHLGHSPLFLPCRPLPENVNCFSYSVQHQFIYSYPCLQCSLAETATFCTFTQFAAHVVFKLLYQNLLK